MHEHHIISIHSGPVHPTTSWAVSASRSPTRSRGRDWIRRVRGSRGLRLTASGRSGLRRVLGVTLDGEVA
ncbi:MAG: hypothetical protein ACREOU_07775 [Candidatus Eiseniibacteriota bacterium]